MNAEQIKNQLQDMSHNELVEAMHAHGIAPLGKYGASKLIATDKEKVVNMLIEKITILQP